MKELIELAVAIPSFVIIYQFYSYAVSSKGEERQKKCLTLGVVFSTLGVTGLALQSVVTVFGGIILMMIGFRLLAYGLDRIDKKVFIDHFAADDTPAALQRAEHLPDTVLAADDQKLSLSLENAPREQVAAKENFRHRDENLPDSGTELPGALFVGSK